MTAPDEADVKRVTEALAAPFDPSEVKWKPQTVSGARALVIAFVDARVIQDRLDDVVGIEGWQDRYTILPDGAVVCRLKVKLGSRWITKEDVGGQSEQPDEGDRRKAAFSDALKRAAVKFGIGRYLYRLKPQWVDYDPQKRQLVGTPRLPAHALPPSEEPAKPAPAPAPAAPPQQPAGADKEKARRPGKAEQASKFLMAKHIQAMAEARTSRELETAGLKIAQDKPLLTPDHALALRDAYKARLEALQKAGDAAEAAAVQAEGQGKLPLAGTGANGPYREGR